MIALQLGTLINRSVGLTDLELISGTTSGTAASMRNALELSITYAPARRAWGANSFERVAPALKKATSTPSKDSRLTSSTFTSRPRNCNTLPADLPLASNRNEATGNSLPSKSRKNSPPTAPVAPRIATLRPGIVDALLTAVVGGTYE